MFLENFSNYLLGYVVFRAQGGFSERFINLCSNNKIFIWDVRREDDCVLGCVEAADYKMLRHFAKKTGMILHAEKKVGLPFLIFHNKYRFALPIAAFVFSVIFFALSRFIWTVEVVGNENIPSEDIVSVFEEIGIKPGTLKSRVDVSKAADEALLEIDGIDWAAVNLNGSNAAIEVREKVKAPQISSNSQVPTNIVSSVSGVVKRIDLYKGTQCVNVGDAVLEGDVLVTGAVTNKDTSVSFCEAQAYISVQTNSAVSCEIKRERFLRSYTKSKKRYVLSFFSLEIPLNFLFLSDGECDFFESSYFLEADGKKLPVGIICQRYDYYEMKTVTHEEKFSRLCAIESFMNEVSKNFSDKLVLSEHIEIGKKEILGSFESIQSAGEKRKMNVVFDENGSEEN